MRRASNRIPESAEKTVQDIRRATRRHHSAEEKIRIVLEGLRVPKVDCWNNSDRLGAMYDQAVMPAVF
jgi:hypothetical protein